MGGTPLYKISSSDPPPEGDGTEKLWCTMHGGCQKFLGGRGGHVFFRKYIFEGSKIEYLGYHWSICNTILSFQVQWLPVTPPEKATVVIAIKNHLKNITDKKGLSSTKEVKCWWAIDYHETTLYFYCLLQFFCWLHTEWKNSPWICYNSYFTILDEKHQCLTSMLKLIILAKF